MLNGGYEDRRIYTSNRLTINITVVRCVKYLVGKDKPIIAYLNRHVTTRVCGACSNPEVWRDLGRELLGQEVESQLNAIAVNSDGNVIQCCSGMFSLWLERQPGASWRQLINALINVNLVSLATEIEKSLITTLSEQQQDTQQILTKVQGD